MALSTFYRGKQALIIGIDKYPSNSLQYCINDATDVNQALQLIGFRTSLGINCTLHEFYQIIDRFAENVQHDDLVLCYFAGHGKQNADENFLLPADYDYDYRTSEHEYIVQHAVNVEYLMKKIKDRKCLVTIYLLDCCRQTVRTRAMNAKEGLTAMIPPQQTLIVFACAPGKSVLDETRNNRNGSFVQNLLTQIATPNTDIEEIIKTVAALVSLQTGGFQLLYRTSCLLYKVSLVSGTMLGTQSIDRPSLHDTRRRAKVSHQENQETAIAIGVHYLVLNKYCSIFNDNRYNKVFITVESPDVLLGTFETPKSFPIGTPDSKYNFDFIASQSIESGQKRHSLTKLLERSSPGEIKFIVLAEPSSENKTQHCIDIGCAVVNVKDICKDSKDVIERLINVHATNGINRVLGYMSVTVKMIDAMRNSLSTIDIGDSNQKAHFIGVPN